MPRIGRVIQVDRLIFDIENNTNERNSIIPNLSSSFVQRNESYVCIPADKIKIIRLTHENLNTFDLEKLFSINSQSPARIKSTNEGIVSPIYETIDHIEKNLRLETLC